MSSVMSLLRVLTDLLLRRMSNEVREEPELIKMIAGPNSKEGGQWHNASINMVARDSKWHVIEEIMGSLNNTFPIIYPIS